MKILKNKKGSALLQVLVIGALIATFSVVILRFSFTRTINTVKTTRYVAAKNYAEGCMAWFTADAMLRELVGRPPDISWSGAPSRGRFTDCSYKIGDSDTERPQPIVFEEVYSEPNFTSTEVLFPILKVTIDVENPDSLR
ncbi:MAG: hypothetical protein LBR90_03320 [Elusimicrobiota bacterium]|jgi:hypothetical protein|nr:hypothetical protein [Elusimicrobiota bacterium]